MESGVSCMICRGTPGIPRSKSILFCLSVFLSSTKSFSGTAEFYPSWTVYSKFAQAIDMTVIPLMNRMMKD